ncbi:hypothetical protein ERJ75_000310400 [Trypanosoma vivax]|nr:hypothetical protein ERJ75_000310400 [Trypanosoma vivax]
MHAHALVTLLAAAVSVAPAAMAVLRADGPVEPLFAAFKQKYGRSYGTAAEEAFRLRVFEDNMRRSRMYAGQTRTRRSVSRRSRTSRPRSSGHATTTASATSRQRGGA